MLKFISDVQRRLELGHEKEKVPLNVRKEATFHVKWVGRFPYDALSYRIDISPEGISVIDPETKLVS